MCEVCLANDLSVPPRHLKESVFECVWRGRVSSATLQLSYKQVGEVKL